MATIACRAGWTVQIGRSIERNPPVGPSFDMVRKPAALLNIPLRRERIVIIASLSKVALFPAASIDESHLIETKRDDRIRVREISEDGFRMVLGVADDIRHAGLLPPLVGFSVAFLTTLRPNEMRPALAQG